MDEERERGRIEGLRTRRLETALWAETFIPLLARARSELPVWRETGEPSQSAYAQWLNDKGVSTRRRGGRWAPETVRRLFDTHIGLIDEAEHEFKIAMGILRFKRKDADADVLIVLAQEEIAVREYRAQQIGNARQLGARLRGRISDDQDNPPSLSTLMPRRKKQKKPAQLSLF